MSIEAETYKKETDRYLTGKLINKHAEGILIITRNYYCDKMIMYNIHSRNVTLNAI